MCGQWYWIYFGFLIRNTTSIKIETTSILFNEVHFTCDNSQSTCVIIAQLPWRNAKLISIRFDSIDLQNWWFFGLTLLLFLFSQYKYTAIRSNTWPMQISLSLNLTPFTSQFTEHWNKNGIKFSTNAITKNQSFSIGAKTIGPYRH